MLSDDISTLFAKALKKFESVLGQPTDSHLAELREVLSQVILVVLYDDGNGVHNLVGIIEDPTTYTMDYTTSFPQPRKPTIYDMSINYNEKAPVRARK